MRFANKKALLIVTLCTAMIAAQGLAQKEQDHDEQATNLKILPNNISDEELHKIMKHFSMSLGVHCNFCHVSQKVEGQERPRMDFASDDKPEKNVARDMMRMTASINKDLGKMGDHDLEQITCVTCHHGNTKPLVSVDSLMKK